MLSDSCSNCKEPGDGSQPWLSFQLVLPSPGGSNSQSHNHKMTPGVSCLWGALCIAAPHETLFSYIQPMWLDYDAQIHAKHYSGSCWESIFGREPHLNWWVMEGAGCPYNMAGLSSLVEGLTRKGLTSSPKRSRVPAGSLKAALLPGLPSH